VRRVSDLGSDRHPLFIILFLCGNLRTISPQSLWALGVNKRKFVTFWNNGNLGLRNISSTRLVFPSFVQPLSIKLRSLFVLHYMIVYCPSYSRQFTYHLYTRENEPNEGWNMSWFQVKWHMLLVQTSSSVLHIRWAHWYKKEVAMTIITALTQMDMLVLCLYPGKITLKFNLLYSSVEQFMLCGMMEENSTHCIWWKTIQNLYRSFRIYMQAMYLMTWGNVMVNDLNYQRSNRWHSCFLFV
jgi:hypothetical protein